VGVVAVEDVIDAFMAVWQRGRPGERYICNGENLLFGDLFAMIAREAGARPPSIRLPKGVTIAIGRTGDLLEAIGLPSPLESETARAAVLYHWFDASKAKSELGLRFKPAAQAIAASVRWMRDYGRLPGPRRN
jgi:dihydroflavonol-4-reductase